MPHTASGRYYTIVNGRRRYNARYDRAAQAPRRQQRAPAPRPRAQPRARQVVVYEQAPAPVSVPRAEVTQSSSLGRKLLEGGGQALGSIFGPVGGQFGRMAGGALSSIFGLGDYKINKNVFLSGKLPVMVNDSPSGGTIIRHNEYIGDIVTSGTANTFDIQEFDLNPAHEGTFPWLAQIAANYEEYSMEGLVFQFRSTSADALNSVNTALGSVIMATNYDASDPAFASKAEMLNYEFSTSCKPSESCLHMIECEPNQSVLSNLYCRPGDVPAGDDQRFYDMGKFQIATAGFQGTNVTIGELHATYQVRLLKPKLFASLGNDINYSLTTNGVGVTAAAPLGTAGSQVEAPGTNLTLTRTSVDITFPISRLKEQYIIELYVAGTVAGAITMPLITLTNADVVNITIVAPQSALAGATSGAALMHMRTRGDGEAPVVTFGVAGTYPTGTVTNRLYVVQTPLTG